MRDVNLGCQYEFIDCEKAIIEVIFNLSQIMISNF